MTDGSNAPDSGTPEQRPPGWQPPAEPARTWAPPGYPPAYGQPPAAPSQQPYPQPYPQPGQQPYPPPYPPQPYGGPQPYQPLYQARPVYKPGTIPLRPLGLGDIFSGSVETVRRNPKATLGVAALVLTGFMLIPVLGALAWGGIQGFSSKITDSSTTSDVTPEDIGLLVSTIGGAVLSWLATIVLTGMIVHVVEHAARGQKLSAGDAWKLTRPRVWRLLGLSLLTVLVPVVVIWLPIGILAVLAFLVSDVAGVVVVVLGIIGGLLLTAYLYTRLFQLAAASVVLEQRNCFAAMRRSWALSSGQFWRIFGISLLTSIVVGVAGGFLSMPFQLASAAGPAIWPDKLLGVLVAILATNIGSVVSGALTTPFSAGVAALQYVDQRIRKEGYDVQLIAQVPVPTPGAVPR